jgi:single-strand DNA-binding protein
MELVGTIKVLFEEKAISAKFRKRELVLVTEDRYPQPILVEFTQEKIGLLDRVTAGDRVRIGIDIRGREWTSPRGEVKYFVSIQGWKIDNLDAATASADAGPSAPAEPGLDDAPFPDSPDGGGSFNDDDIPF